MGSGVCVKATISSFNHGSNRALHLLHEWEEFLPQHHRLQMLLVAEAKQTFAKHRGALCILIN